jgi:hypothetical protein
MTKKKPNKIKHLIELNDFIFSYHPSIKIEGIGVTAFKLLKNKTSKTIIEETKGWRITKFVVDNNSIIIKFLANYSSLNSFKKNKILSSNLYLRDLCMVNIFEDSAEFITNGLLDFSYVVNDEFTESKLLKNWISKKDTKPIIQWINEDQKYFNNIDRMLFEESEPEPEITIEAEERMRFL